MEGIQVIYRRDPANIWMGSRKCIGGIQVLYGRDSGITWDGSRYRGRRLYQYKEDGISFQF